MVQASAIPRSCGLSMRLGTPPSQLIHSRNIFNEVYILLHSVNSCASMVSYQTLSLEAIFHTQEEKMVWSTAYSPIPISYLAVNKMVMQCLEKGNM